MVSQLTLSRGWSPSPNPRAPAAYMYRTVPPPRPPAPPPRRESAREDAGRRAALAARRLPKSASAARRPRLPVWLTVHIPKGASSQIQMLVVYLEQPAGLGYMHMYM